MLIKFKKPDMADDMYDDIKAQEFKGLMYSWNEALLNNQERLDFLEQKRGITKDTVADCYIGINEEKRFYTFPNIQFTTEDVPEVIGFELRPFNFDKKFVHRLKGGITGMVQINTYNYQPCLVFLEGFLDACVFYQYLKEIGKLDEFHIATSSNGAASIYRHVKAMSHDFSKYKSVIAYLDSDETGINVMRMLKYKYPFIKTKIMNCGCKDFNEHYIHCIKREG